MKTVRALAFTSSLFAATFAAAASLTFDPGVIHVVTPAMEEYTTYGSDMAGMKMTVVQGGVAADYTWGVLPDEYLQYNVGGLITDSFVIKAIGDTWCALGICRQWWVQALPLASAITQIVFHGASAGVVFDLATTPDANFGTPGSARGTTYELTATNLRTAPEVDAVYRNQVRVGANPVVGDLWTDLELNFTGTGLGGGAYIQFMADTDRIPGYATLAPDIHTPAVPEPQSAALLLAGGVLLGAWARRRNVQR